MSSHLVERAGQQAAEPALIQNGNKPEAYSEGGVVLVERAGQQAAEPALIQNGNKPDAYTEHGVR